MKKRFTDEQMIAVLKESEAGTKTGELCRRHGKRLPTFYRRRPLPLPCRHSLARPTRAVWRVEKLRFSTRQMLRKRLLALVFRSLLQRP